MTALDRAHEVIYAIQDSINCLFHLRELRADPPLVSAAELEEWGGIFDRAQLAFAEIQVETQAGRAWTSLRLNSDLVLRFADVRAHLSTIMPGTRLPTSLFDLIDVAWAEVAKAISRDASSG